MLIYNTFIILYDSLQLFHHTFNTRREKGRIHNFILYFQLSGKKCCILITYIQNSRVFTQSGTCDYTCKGETTSQTSLQNHLNEGHETGIYGKEQASSCITMFASAVLNPKVSMPFQNHLPNLNTGKRTASTSHRTQGGPCSEGQLTYVP